MSEFSIKSYIEAFVEAHKLDEGFDFAFTQVSGINGLEGILQGQMADNNFIATDSTGDGHIFQQHNGGFFIKRVATVFIVRKYAYGDMTDMLDKVKTCRLWFKKILRQMIADKEALNNKLIYLNTERVAFRELAPEMAAHFTGLYFMLEYHQPYDVLND